MPLLVRNIMMALDEPEEEIVGKVAKRLGLPDSAIRTYAVVARAIDARRGTVSFNYHLEVALNELSRRDQLRIINARNVTPIAEDTDSSNEPVPGNTPLRDRPVIVGFGPAGMFAALRLATFGFRPIVLERGREVRRRHRDVMQRYYRERDFDPESNLLFGEGGAGTYSDGKLYTRISDPLCRYVLEVLYHHGADPDILINTRPHVGSDRLPTVCTRIRYRIQSLGGEVRFDTALTDIEVDSDRIARIETRNHATDRVSWSPTGPLLLALGHSARDTLRMLCRRGIVMSAKPFQIGVRIEHPQEMVDKRQYGQAAGHARLGPAEYHLVAKHAAGAGNLFSFCMCPGGQILPTNESPGLIATNGASRVRRSGPYANSGLVITLDAQALGMSALDALAYQERWERKAFEATGGSYAVPCQRASDFLREKGSNGTLATSFPLGGQWANIREVIPVEVADALMRGLSVLDRKIHGFAGDQGIITAPETRASAPIRMDRDRDSRCALGVEDLYPVGEGAGYAGGIVSAAVDGIKSADAIIARYAPLS
ncbi:MAG: NAD(P)/FAD-dependent oxidoreductase [Planctomycetota bacterium]|jgi:uncharacterized FAD-dependent dehydrogenase